MTAEPLTGIVEEFDEARGLGAVRGDDGRIYPFHCIEIADGSRTIEVGIGVGFEQLRKLGRVEAARIRPA